MMKKQAGFSALELLIVLIIFGLVGGGGWLLYHRAQVKTVTTSVAAPAAASPAKTVPISTALADIKQVAQKFDYVGPPTDGHLYMFSTNMPSIGWYVGVRDSQDLAFTASKSVSGYTWIDHAGIPAADRSAVISQSQQFSDAIAAQFKADGFTARNTSLKFGYTEDANEGLYQAPTGVCQLEHTADIPATISIECIATPDIAALKAATQPFVTAFKAKHPERPVTSAVFDTPQFATSSTGVQYAQDDVSDPYAIDTHPTDGAHYYQKKGASWSYVTDATICGTDPAGIPAKLSALGITDSGAPAVFTGFCKNLGP